MKHDSVLSRKRLSATPCTGHSTTRKQHITRKQSSPRMLSSRLATQNSKGHSGTPQHNNSTSLFTYFQWPSDDASCASMQQIKRVGDCMQCIKRSGCNLLSGGGSHALARELRLFDRWCMKTSKESRSSNLQRRRNATAPRKQVRYPNGRTFSARSL